MALPFAALALGALRRTKLGKKVNTAVVKLGKKVAGKVFKNNKIGRTAKISSTPVMNAQPITVASIVPDPKQVVSDQNSGFLPNDWPKKVGDVLGDITGPSREITTNVDQKTLLTIGGIVIAAILLMSKR